ncbi:MAG TPA: N-acetylmuramic acid 6-phosphate etherase [Jiangellaceae bacterium]|nr:N-acetylmuramic acid 6-phosphate etherase [Jiangellaceae bacterium]
MAEELDRLDTEGRLPEAADLDQLTTLEQLELMGRQDQMAVEAVAAARAQLARAVDLAAERLRSGGRLIELGAGTPGRLAVLDAAECGPTFGVDERVIAVMAGGSDAVRNAIERNEDDFDLGVADVRNRNLGPDDVVIAVSASGRTPYVLGAVEVARESGALTIAVVNNPGSALASICDVAIEALTGPEIISGSTRLKAGTAQKLVLNTISTLVMVRLGRTYGDLMVDVRASNAKLRRRAQRMVMEATGASEGDVAAALEAAGGEATVALVMLLAEVDADTARARLAAVYGHVREAAATPRSASVCAGVDQRVMGSGREDS